MNRREILFRGKRLDGTWAEGYYVFNEETHGIVDSRVFPGSWSEVDPSTIGQLHNALTRKAGSKVFVGDIIRHDLEEGLGQPKRIGETSTVNSVEFDYAYYTNVRVVGTIHDTHLTKQS